MNQAQSFWWENTTIARRIVHVSSVEFHEEFNGTTPGAEKVGLKKRTQKKLQNSAKNGLKQGKKQTYSI